MINKLTIYLIYCSVAFNQQSQFILEMPYEMDFKNMWHTFETFFSQIQLKGTLCYVIIMISEKYNN